MVAIRVLPPEVVNRIAAGEVIERPASVVKELIENSIDAGATKIIIQVEEGGRKRIRVRDNGGGIAPEDLPLAFESHATSKLPLDDAARPEERGLFAVSTLGFRGEALASIAAVAEVEMTSRAAGSECAYTYRPACGGSRAVGPEPAAAPAGTTIEVRNLFAGMPARRKFLRSEGTELSHIANQVVRLAMGFPRIGFLLEHGGKKVLDLPATADVRERIAAALGTVQSKDLIEVAFTDAAAPGRAGTPASFDLRGYIGAPQVARADTRGQNFFVNGRWIRDRILAHALRDAFQGFQIPGKNPVAYLFLSLPHQQVDINVHPQKLEVRFLDSQSVHRWIFRSVRAALEAGGSRAAAALEPAELFQGEGGEAGGAAVEQKSRIQQAALDFFASGPRPPGPAHEPSLGPAAPPRARAPAFQVLREFIIAEKEGGLVVIDQHALHEKVLYERILRRLKEKSFPSQRLLIPEVVALPLHLVPLIPRIIEQLAAFGFELEPFGEREVAVQAVPVVLDRGPAAAVVREVAEGLLRHPEKEEREAAGVIGGSLRRIAQMMACKQAVKAGMKLEPDEIQALLEESQRAEDPRYCPHGRPASILITREELERRFDRK
ncbi:MAG: DNA mismatch repair endonuclease MutL [Planctomycetes bacterium]|nr:DNA mismatch repair endonuclease MutL [Planctomycetota bacterium]